MGFRTGLMIRRKIGRDQRAILQRVAAQIQHPVPLNFKQGVRRQRSQEMQVGYRQPHHHRLRAHREREGSPQSFLRDSLEQKFRAFLPAVPFEPDAHYYNSLMRGAREEKPGGLRLRFFGQCDGRLPGSGGDTC